jgi:hypothetical protein
MPARPPPLDVPALLVRVTALCLALPEVRRGTWGRHADFSVCRKSLARFLDDYHGDGIVGVPCRAARRSALGARRSALGAGRWALGAGRWALGVGRWALGVGR